MPDARIFALRDALYWRVMPLPENAIVPTRGGHDGSRARRADYSSAAISISRAFSQLRRTVRSESPNASAISASDKPPK